MTRPEGQARQGRRVSAPPRANQVRSRDEAVTSDARSVGLPALTSLRVSRSRSIGAVLVAAAALLPAGALAATAADPAATGSAPAASTATPSPFRADRA